MYIPNMIRAGILLIAGLILLIFPKQVIKIQTKILKKLHIKYRDTKKTLLIAGIIFLIISAVLVIFSVTN